MAEQEKSTSNSEATKASKVNLAERADNNGQINVRADGQPVNGQTKDSAGLALRNVPKDAPAAIELSGTRPISQSYLEIYGTYLNNRPISASHLKVAEYFGSRPIFASELTVWEDYAGRPIVTSDPKLMEGSTLPGGRPIASNEIDNSETLMGFLD